MKLVNSLIAGRVPLLTSVEPDKHKCQIRNCGGLTCFVFTVQRFILLGCGHRHSASD
jgi:hypothetical protein